MFRTAIVCPPCSTFARGLTTGRKGSPDLDLAVEQHRAYVRALERCGLAIVELEPDAQHPDSTFVEDAAVMVPGGAFLARPGADSRRGEVDAIRRALRPRVSRLWTMEAPGTLDGGDVCEIGSHYLIGISERTNEAGARQLESCLSEVGCTSARVEFDARDGLLHLKSGLSWLGGRRLAVVDALARHRALEAFERLRVVPEEGEGANLVRVNEHVLIAAGCPRLEEQVQALGLPTLVLEMSEFQKMEGGLSCLSLRLGKSSAPPSQRGM